MKSLRFAKATNSLPNRNSSAFTIIELLIVIVVIAILAVIASVAYGGIQKRALDTTQQSDLRSAATQLGLKQVEDGTYPNPNLPNDIKASGNNTFQYTSNGTNYCLTITNPNSTTAYHLTNTNTAPQTGLCEGHEGSEPEPDPTCADTGQWGTYPDCYSITNGISIQLVTNSNCPTDRIRAVDARDNHTYWVQKLADGKCWMLTNLAYAGGGTNTYGDVKTLTTGGTYTYTAARYYASSGSNVTTEPTNPSTSTTGTGQYGYLYNWCGAMGGQATAACANATTPEPNTSISVCPAGWRLPIGNGGEFTALNTAVNNGATNTDAGLRTNWFGQRSGSWYNGFYSSGTGGYYWSSTQGNNANAAHMLSFTATSATPANGTNKYSGLAVRCVAI